MLLRALIALAIVVLRPVAAWAEAAPDAPLPLEVQWLKVAAQVISTVGMPGVIAGLIYLLKMQKDDREKERQEAKTEIRAVEDELKAERDFNRKAQEDRIAAAAAGADRLATVAVSSSNAITTAAEKNAGVISICQEIKNAIYPVAGDHRTIIDNQAAIGKAINDVALAVGKGCRAP